MFICFDNPITNLQFSFVLFLEDLSHYKWGRVISNIGWNKWKYIWPYPEPNQVNSNPSNDDEQESEPELIPVRPRKSPQQNLLVHSIDSAFDETNFTQIELPAENNTYEVEIEAKKKDPAAKIVTWKSKKPTPTGRLGHHNIISEKPGPTKCSNKGEDSSRFLEAFSFRWHYIENRFENNRKNRIVSANSWS